MAKKKKKDCRRNEVFLFLVMVFALKKRRARVTQKTRGVGDRFANNIPAWGDSRCPQ